MTAPLRLVRDDDAHRRAARVWLRGVQRTGPARSVVIASELLVALELEKEPSATALAWLRAKATEGRDAVRKAWAQTLLDELGCR